MMENFRTKNNIEDQFSQQEEQESLVLIYIKKRFSFIFRVGVYALIVALALCAAVFLLAPKQKVFSLKGALLLEKTKDGNFCYPSGKLFSSNDLISLPVLQKVYKDLHLSEKIKFSAFASSFYVLQENFKDSALDAVYQKKLTASKTLSVVDVQKIENSYRTEKAQLLSSEFKIFMKPDKMLTDDDASKILCAVPQAWFNIYSRLEARVFPELDNSDLIRQLNKDIKAGYYFIPLLKARRVCQRMLKTCQNLNEMKKNKKITLNSGESLDDLILKISMLNEYQFEMFALYIQTHKGYRGAVDYVYIISSIQGFERELSCLNAKYEAAQQAKDLIVMRNGKSGVRGKAESDGMILQLNNNFLDSLSTLIRNDVNGKLLKEYAEKILVLKDKIAEVESEKKYYEQLLGNKYQDLEKLHNVPTMPAELLKNGINNAFAELGVLNGLLIAMKDKIADEYLTSREFYSSLNNVLPVKIYGIALVGTMGGFLCLLFAFCMILYGIDFARMNKSGKLADAK